MIRKTTATTVDDLIKELEKHRGKSIFICGVSGFRLNADGDSVCLESAAKAGGNTDNGTGNDAESVQTLPCKDGVIIAELGGDSREYRGIYVYLQRPDGTVIDLCNAEGNYHSAKGDEEPTEGAEENVQDSGVKVRVWTDPYSDSYTDVFEIDTSVKFED
jgi:hypothetical protein